MRPGGSTICRIERAITLLPEPLSPTIAERACRARASSDTPSTAFTRPLRTGKCVARSRTSQDRRRARRAGPHALVGWCDGVQHGHLLYGSAASRRPSPRKLSAMHGGHHDGAGREQPGRGRDRADVLRLAQQHAPGDGRRLQAEAEERQRGLGQDHRRDRERDRRDDVAHEARQHVAEDDPPFGAAVEPRRGDELLGAQRQEAAAHHAGELRPAGERQDQR